MIRNNQNRRRRGGNNNGPRPQQMNGGNNYGNRLDNRQRGNASQLLEKYRALARDAQQAGDRVTAEYYLQYADHYFRVLGDYREKSPNDGRQRGREFYDDDATGYNAGSDDTEGADDDEQDADRSDDRNDTDARGDDGRNQWRDAPREARNNDGRNRDGNRDTQREPRNSDTPREARNGDGRDRQNWNGNGAPRNRDEPRAEQRSRDEGRAERPRDEGRNERNRDEGRSERPRERRPDYQRPAPVEAVIADEGPIPGLPGPATLRVKRPPADDIRVDAERPVRTLRRDPPPVVDTAAVAVEAELPVAEAAPRRRGRPRKVVDTDSVEG